MQSPAMMVRAHLHARLWAVTMIMLVAKLVLVADIPVHIRFSPFDDSLYVTRAYEFLNGNGWGPYSAYALSKLPGISLWLGASRILGVPYLLGINVVYGLAGIYLLRAASKAGVGQGILVLSYAIYLANPVTFSVGWALVMREALSSLLMVALLGASLHILVHKGPQLPKAHVALLTLVFALTLLLREEDVLIWSYLLLLMLGVGWHCRWGRGGFNARAAAAVLLLPACAALAAQHSLREYNRERYGAPMLTDFGEGELPKLIAAIRSVDSTTDNRMVMIPQDVLKKLRPMLPEFAPVVDALPPPGRLTYSCKQSRVCSEWNSGYMIWWIKQAAAEAGLTPTLPTGQAYFRSVRMHIESLCASGDLSCRRNGDGMLPPMQLRWLRAYLQEFRALVAMLVVPTLDLVPTDAQAINGATNLVRTYQQVTMTSTTENPRPGSGELAIFGGLADWRATLAFADGFLLAAAFVVSSAAILWRLAMYPGVRASPLSSLSLIFWTYSGVRLLALAYVAVYFGPYEARIIFSTYTGLAILSALTIWECWAARQLFRARLALC